MTNEAGHLINAVAAVSIAEELGIAPGDRLLALDGIPVIDVFDYRTRQMTDQLILTIEKPDAGLFEYDIEKGEDEDLGLEFHNSLMTDCDDCQNHCVFCFIDQLPQGLRQSLYIKDDDMRLSFLTGNYVTLTNIDDAGLDRLISYRLSPVNLSVHTTDPKLRTRMMRNRQAGNILDRMHKIAAAGLAMNAQIVICPGYNDGAALDRTLTDLITLGQAMQSIAIVPVGLTRFREDNNLLPLRGLVREDALRLLETVGRCQREMLQLRGIRLVYAADEIYIKAGVDFPAASEYDDFPQLENGVGMTALMQLSLSRGLGEKSISSIPPIWSAGDQSRRLIKTAIMVTGTAAGPFLSSWLTRLAGRFGLDVRLVPVINHFFGESITVAGLLTGCDIKAQVAAALRCWPEVDPAFACLILPGCSLKADEIGRAHV